MTDDEMRKRRATRETREARNARDEEREEADILRIPLAEETVEAHITERELGKVVIRKRVEVEPVKADFDLQQDDVVVERVARDEVVTEAKEPWYEGDTLVIPLYEEQLVSEIRLVLKEEVRVRSTPTHKHVSLKDEVRREVVDIKTIKNPPSSS